MLFFEQYVLLIMRSYIADENAYLKAELDQLKKHLKKDSHNSNSHLRVIALKNLKERRRKVHESPEDRMDTQERVLPLVLKSMKYSDTKWITAKDVDTI